jgi:hypothetical protein
MPRKKTVERYEDRLCDLSIDGCGSACVPESCIASQHNACRGCTDCDFKDSGCKKKVNSCARCWVRCYRRPDLNEWLKDIKGLDLDKPASYLPFTGDLPFFIPQVKNTTYGIYHPAYMLSIKRFLNPQNLRWFYKKSDFRKAYKISPDTKVLLVFYAEDDLIESIWTNQYNDWGGGKNFWDSLAEFKFDGVASVNYSCFANHPRMEHIINIKRNILTAERLSAAGIPVVLDIMWHSESDFDRLLAWGVEHGTKWYGINCQTLKKASWTLPLIYKYANKVLTADPNARIIINGIINYDRVVGIVKEFGNRVHICNFGAFLNVAHHNGYSIDNKKWLHSDKPLPDLWQETIQAYEDWGKGK